MNRREKIDHSQQFKFNNFPVGLFLSLWEKRKEIFSPILTATEAKFEPVQAIFWITEEYIDIKNVNNRHFDIHFVLYFCIMNA